MLLYTHESVNAPRHGLGPHPRATSQRAVQFQKWVSGGTRQSLHRVYPPLVGPCADGPSCRFISCPRVAESDVPAVDRPGRAAAAATAGREHRYAVVAKRHPTAQFPGDVLQECERRGNRTQSWQHSWCSASQRRRGGVWGCMGRSQWLWDLTRIWGDPVPTGVSGVPVVPLLMAG